MEHSSLKIYAHKKYNIFSFILFSSLLIFLLSYSIFNPPEPREIIVPVIILSLGTLLFGYPIFDNRPLLCLTSKEVIHKGKFLPSITWEMIEDIFTKEIRVKYVPSQFICIKTKIDDNTISKKKNSKLGLWLKNQLNFGDIPIEVTYSKIPINNIVILMRQLSNEKDEEKRRYIIAEFRNREALSIS